VKNKSICNQNVGQCSTWWTDVRPAEYRWRPVLNAAKFGSSPLFKCRAVKVKVKAFPYSIPSVGPGADPGVQAVSPQVTVWSSTGGRLPLLSARPAVTYPAAEHHRPLAGTKLYCVVTEAHRCEQLVQGCYAALPRVGFERATYWSQVQRSTRCTTAPPALPRRAVTLPKYESARLGGCKVNFAPGKIP